MPFIVPLDVAQYGAQWLSLFLKLFQSIVSIGDTISGMLQLVFAGLGVVWPIWAFRIISIVASLLVLFGIWNSIGFKFKLVLFLLIMSVVLAALIGSAFGPGLFA